MVSASMMRAKFSCPQSFSPAATCSKRLDHNLLSTGLTSAIAR